MQCNHSLFFLICVLLVINIFLKIIIIAVIITIIPTEIVMEPVYKTLRRILFIVAAVLFIAILFYLLGQKIMNMGYSSKADSYDKILSALGM